MFYMIFFKTLNSTEHNDDLDQEADANIFESDMLNCDITEEEVLKNIKKLKKTENVLVWMK